MKKVKLKEVQGLLDSGKDPKEIFDCVCFKYEDFRIVVLGDNWNYIDKNNKLLSDEWFDWCIDFCGGFAIVKLNSKWNYIKPNGEFLSEQWFDNCWDFYDDFGRVIDNGVEYLIDKFGKLHNSNE